MVCILLSYLLLFQAKLVPASLVYFGCEKHKGDCFTHITISLVGIYMVYLVKKCALFYRGKHLLNWTFLSLQLDGTGRRHGSWSVDTCQSWVRAPSKAPVVSLSKKLYSHCLVLVGSRNGLERDLHKQIIACFKIKLK